MILQPVPDAADRDAAKRLRRLHAIHSRLPVGLSWFPDIHVHVNAALRTTHEQITCEQSRPNESRPA